jgi:hypothetical protein
VQFRDKQLRFQCQRSAEVTGKDFFIKGEYRPYDDSQDDVCIYITLVFNPRCRKITFTDYNWESISFYLADTVTHEYLHQYYCRQRGYKHGRGYRSISNNSYLETMKDYLGCEDEILAYSFNVASEMIVYNRELEKTKIYRWYKKHFKQDSKVLLQLKKQTRKYIKQLELK